MMLCCLIIFGKMKYKTYKCRQICEGSTSHVPTPPSKSTKRVSNLHQVNNSSTQLLSMSHSHVHYNHVFCITIYTYCNIFYLSFSHLNLMRLSFVVGCTLLPPYLVLTTYPNLRGHLSVNIHYYLTFERRLSWFPFYLLWD